MATEQLTDFKQREQTILNNALRLFVQFGYDKTSVSDIARKSGVAKGTIYLHWESKEALFADLLKRESERLGADWLKRVMDDPDGGRIGAIFRHSLLALAENPLMRSLYTEESYILGEYIRRRGSTIYSQRYIASLDFVKHLQSAGIIRSDLPADSINHLFMIIACGLISVESVMAGAPFPPPETFANALNDMLERALTPTEVLSSSAGKQILLDYLNTLA